MKRMKSKMKEAKSAEIVEIVTKIFTDHKNMIPGSHSTHFLSFFLSFSSLSQNFSFCFVLSK